MKILSGVAIGLLLLSAFCPAASAGKDIYFVGGLNLANLSGDADQFGDALADTLESQVGGTWTSSKSIRVGFDGGIGFGYWGSGALGGAIELHYASRGVKWDINEQSGSGIKLDAKLKLDYVEIPVLLQVSPSSPSKVHGQFLVGPVLGIRASSKFDVEGGGGASSTDISDDMKSTYFGGLAGAGIRIQTQPGSAVLLQARFLLGFTNLVDDPDFNVKPQDFTFLAGYSIGLK